VQVQAYWRRKTSGMTDIINDLPLRSAALVRQPHLVMFEVLSLVVALFGACLVGSSPV
jgi:hypothetical protein